MFIFTPFTCLHALFNSSEYDKCACLFYFNALFEWQTGESEITFYATRSKVEKCQSPRFLNQINVESKVRNHGLSKRY